jgi:uncharacterized surface protein with fasciclin (FAS1) repeats
MKNRLAVLAAMFVGVASLAVTAQAAPTGQAASDKTIVSVAAGDKRFTTLVALVKQAGLVTTLNGKGPFTVFAPTNAAFAKLKAQAPDTFEAVSTDKALLTKVLTYHVLAKRVPSTAALAAAKQGASVKTVQGEPIKLSLKSGKIVLNGSSRVVVADVKASNGVIHAIDAVLVPPSIAKG